MTEQNDGQHKDSQVPPVGQASPPAFIPRAEFPQGDAQDPRLATMPGAGPYYGPVAPRTNTLSIISLVTGFFCSIAAVITGHIALNQIKRTGEAGRGLAIAGLVLGYLGVGITALLTVLALVFATTFGLIFSSIVGNTSSVPSVDASGQVGAAYLDDGYLQAGSGDTIVDLYIDPMCPYCGQFELANGAAIAALVDDGSITVRVHALTFLDPASQGSDYSTRAANALTCEAAINPDSMLDYMAALFASQPAEGTTGLSDDELSALSAGAGSIDDCVATAPYAAWSQQNTDDALTGPIPGAEIASIQGTPTVLVNGSQYQGAIDDPQAFVEFVVGAAS